MAEKIVIMGAGGHARVVLEAMRACGLDAIGFTDSDAGKIGQSVLGCQILGDDSYLETLDTGKYLIVVGVGDIAKRRKLIDLATGLKFASASFRHPFSWVAGSASIGAGVQIMAGAVVQSEAAIGSHTIVNTGASVDHDARIGVNCHIAPGAVICGGVVMGDGVLIGAGASVLPNVRIGSGAVVGAGASVSQDVNKDARVFGVPARSKA